MFNRIRDFLCNLRSQQWQRQEEEKGLDQGYYDLPHPKERAKMSPEKLAILLSKQKAGTPAYILVEHELNLRIAHVQARAAAIASYVGIVGVVVGVVLTALVTAWLQRTPDEKPKANQAAIDRNADAPSKGGADLNAPSRPFAEMKSVPPAKQTGEQQKANPKK